MPRMGCGLGCGWDVDGVDGQPGGIGCEGVRGGGVFVAQARAAVGRSATVHPCTRAPVSLRYLSCTSKVLYSPLRYLTTTRRLVAVRSGLCRGFWPCTRLRYARLRSRRVSALPPSAPAPRSLP